MIDLIIKATPSQKLVSCPRTECSDRNEASRSRPEEGLDNTFLNAKGDKALSFLRRPDE